MTIKVADRVHDASKNLAEYWNLNDTCYNFAANVRGISHVLTTVVERPVQPDRRRAVAERARRGTMGADHPVTWCKDYQGGRSFYTTLGTSAAADDADPRDRAVGAMRGRPASPTRSTATAAPPCCANYQQTFVAAPPNLSEPIGFDVLPDGTGRVIQTDRRGGVRLHDPATNSTTLLATIPVYITNEDGMYGPEVDNNFNTNKWVYLYYSPPTVEDVKLPTASHATTPLNDPATPTNEQNAPNFAPSLSAWDPYVGYFQLSRFKFVDATPTCRRTSISRASSRSCASTTTAAPAATSPATSTSTRTTTCGWSRVTTRRPAAATPAASAPFNGMLTNESQTITVANATGGTFTLTFDGQTTAPIAVPLDNAAIEAALEALSNLDDVAVTGTGDADGQLPRQHGRDDVPQLTGDASGLTGTRRRSRSRCHDQQRPGHQHPGRGGLFNAPHVDARRPAQNTDDLRGKLLRIKVKDGDITPAEANRFGGAYTVPAGNLFPSARRGRGPRSTRWASATRSGSRSTSTTSRT